MTRVSVTSLHAPVTGDRRLEAYQTLLERVTGIPECQTHSEFRELFSTHVRELTPFDAVSIWQYDPADRMMRLVMFEPQGLTDLPLSEVPVEFGPGGRAVSSQLPIVLRLSSEPAPPVAGFCFRLGFRVMCFVPASTPDVRWGAVGIASRDVDHYSHELLTVLGRIGTQVARATAGLSPTSRDLPGNPPLPGAPDRTQLLLRLTNAVTSERHLPDLLKTISMLLRETIPHHYASLSIWDERAQGLRRWAAVQPEAATPIPEGELLDKDEPPWLAFESGDVIEIRKEVFRRSSDTKVTAALVARGVQAGVCLPLKTQRGTYGVLNVGSPNADAFPMSEIMLLWQIARQLAVAIENATSSIGRNGIAAKPATSATVSSCCSTSTTRWSQLWTRTRCGSSVLETVRRTLNHDYASLIMFSAGTRELHLEAATYYDERGVLEPHVTTSLDQSPAALAFPWNHPHVFKGAELDQFDVAGVPTLRSAGLQSVCCVPLSTRRGVLGALNIASRRAEAFSQTEVDLLRDVAGQVAIAVENTVAFREISDLKNRLAEEKLYLEDEITSQHDFKEIVGNSPALRNVLQQIQAVAPTDATVLLLGETGTGKELLARALHDFSRRRDRPFIRFNGAALPGGLIESELFGYEKGAFTGADRAKTGRLELAHRGTLFLDEVGDIPLEVQPKLLRALQEREFERLGSVRTQRIDVRLVAATTPQPRGDGGRLRISKRPLLSTERLSDPRAPVAGSARGHPRVGPPLRSEVLTRDGPQHHEDPEVHDGRAAAMALARQRSRAAERDRASDHPVH